VTASTIRFEVLRQSFKGVLRLLFDIDIFCIWRFAVLMAFPHILCGGAQMASKDIEPPI